MTMRRLRLPASRRFGAGGSSPIATPAAARRRSFLAADVRLAAAGVWAILRDAGRKFYADDCATLAAAISFYALLSLIPVLFLIVAILGYVLGSSQDTFNAVLAWAREFIPHLSDDFTRNLQWVVANRGRLSWLGLGSLIIASGLVFHATEFALDRLFAVGKRRSFVRSRLLSMGVVVTMGLVLLFSFYVGVIFHALNVDPNVTGGRFVLQLARGLRI